MKTKELKIDAEFKNLISPLAPEEYADLEKSIKEEGCRDPLVLWDNVILDGHNRYEICMKNGIIFKTVNKNLGGRDDAKVWIIRNQFGRRNLPKYVRVMLALKLKDIFEIKSRENQKNAGGSLPHNCAEAPIETREELAKIAHVSHETVRRVEFIEENASDEIKQQLEQQETSINAAYHDTKRETMKLERIEKRTTLHLPDNIFNVFYADPPWKYNDTCEDGAIQSKGADKHYKVMDTQEICDMDVSKMAASDSVLFLWTTSPMLEECFRVINSWGFRYKASFIWDKIKHNMGHYNSVRHELLLICVKGIFQPEKLKLFDSVVSVEKTRHSEKPEIFREMIDELYPHGKKIELFARKETEGWTAWGDELLQ